MLLLRRKTYANHQLPLSSSISSSFSRSRDCEHKHKARVNIPEIHQHCIEILSPLRLLFLFSPSFFHAVDLYVLETSFFSSFACWSTAFFFLHDLTHQLKFFRCRFKFVVSPSSFVQRVDKYFSRYIKVHSRAGRKSASFRVFLWWRKSVWGEQIKPRSNRVKLIKTNLCRVRGKRWESRE